MSADQTAIHIRDARPAEFADLGRLLVEVYATLPDFPSPEEQPRYYEMLVNIGDFARVDGARVLVALTLAGELAGGVVYFRDMARYGSGGAATTVRNAAGLRLLGVGPRFRGLGIGNALTRHAIDLARDDGLGQVILHTTQAMPVAWRMYEKMGFTRSPDLDFQQQDLPVYGFRLALPANPGGQARPGDRSRGDRAG